MLISVLYTPLLSPSFTLYVIRHVVTFPFSFSEFNFFWLSQNAAQPYAKAEGCVYEDPSRADELRKGWSFSVGT